MSDITSTTRTIKRKRWNAPKLIVLGTLLLTFAFCTWSYILAWRGYDPVVDVSTELIRTFGAVAIAYYIKNAVDHNSANKYGVNEVDDD